MFNQETADAICARVSEGASLRSACKEHGLSHTAFLLWCRTRPELANQYAQAREVGTDAEFEALAELQDETPVRGPSGAVDAGWVAWKRLQIDTKKWELSKKAPKKYGDKLDLNHSGSVNLSIAEAVRSFNERRASDTDVQG